MRLSLAAARACANSTVAASPNWAFAKPSSCSLVFTASSVSTSAEAAWRSSCFVSSWVSGSTLPVGGTADGFAATPLRRRRMTIQTMTPSAAAMRTKRRRPLLKSPPVAPASFPVPPVSLSVAPPVAAVSPSAAASIAPPQSSAASCGWICCCSIDPSWSSVTGPVGSPER